MGQVGILRAGWVWVRSFFALSFAVVPPRIASSLLMALDPWDDADADFEEPDVDEPARSPPGDEVFEDSCPELPVLQAAEPLAAVAAEEEPPIPASPFAGRRPRAELVVPSPKRRRLSGKQSVKLGVAEPVAALKQGRPPQTTSAHVRNLVNNFVTGADSKKFHRYADCLIAPVDWDFHAAGWPQKDGRQRYLLIMKKFRWWLECWVNVIQKNDGEQTADDKRALNVWKAGSKKADIARERNVLVHQFLNEKNAPPCVMDYAVCQWPLEDQDCRGNFLRCRSVLLTWHGDWGTIPKLQSGEPFATDLDQLEGQLRKDSHVLAIWAEFQKRVGEMFSRLCASHYATCVELCTSTWQTEQIVRVHCHAFSLSLGKKCFPNHRCLWFFSGPCRTSPSAKPRAIVGRMSSAVFITAWQRSLETFFLLRRRCLGSISR